ncbi:unnamed protein product [Paramecium octaurelia]|uniref:Zinc finger C2H2 LYAR-type domain-containing protein n=1 Tax=Paramecium octaurelia TaxID=43137 RepID=A0A8S1WE69_PAROT|nr:unnamed protein product [Paramecium octaurelia]
MVTFMCYHCDRTLTKPQVDKHVKTQCRKPPSLICIDCKKMFSDNHVEHVSCLTEKQLYWGPYANGKKPQQQQQNTAKAEQNNQKQKEIENSKEIEEPKKEWKGWKKSIDSYIKSNQLEEVRMNEVKENLVSQFLSIYPEYEKEEAEQLFDEAIKKSNKYQVEYVGFIVKKVKQE